MRRTRSMAWLGTLAVVGIMALAPATARAQFGMKPLSLRPAETEP